MISWNQIKSDCIASTRYHHLTIGAVQFEALDAGERYVRSEALRLPSDNLVRVDDFLVLRHDISIECCS